MKGYVRKFWQKHDLDEELSTNTEWTYGGDSDGLLAGLPGATPKKPRERPGS